MALFVSCESDKGNKVTGGKLSVYFETSEHEELARETANFWRNNNLMTGELQDLKLESLDSVYRLKLIVSEDAKGFVLPATDRKSLMDLQTMLGDSIFGYGKIELILCDNEFKELENLNR